MKIKEILKKADKGYYALSPGWVDDKKKEVRWWLNPRDQKNNNSGWYVFDDLMKWSEGEGPVPKK